MKKIEEYRYDATESGMHLSVRINPAQEEGKNKWTGYANMYASHHDDPNAVCKQMIVGLKLLIAELEGGVR